MNFVYKHKALWSVMKRECRRLVSRPLYLFCMVVAPLFCYVFFTTLMDSGLPQDMPVGIVDQDQTSMTRQLTRTLDAFQQSKVVARYASFDEARRAMQRNEIYGFYYIPEGTTAEAQAQRRPTVSFYTNNTLLIAGSLLFKDMKTMSELASGAVVQATLLAKGATEQQAMDYLQPIVIDTHPLNNPWLNYSVYLNNTFAPGVLMLLIFMVTVFSIGVEIKERTARQSRTELCFVVGSVVILDVRIVFSADGHAPHVAGSGQPVPVAPLFSHLCRPGSQRLSDDLFVEQLRGIAALHVASFLGSTPTERSLDLL